MCNIKEFNEKFSTHEVCLDYLFQSRYGATKKCPKCNKKFSYSKVNNRQCYACAFCGHQIYPLVGTIFQSSTTSLKDWFFFFLASGLILDNMLFNS